MIGPIQNPVQSAASMVPNVWNFLGTTSEGPRFHVSENPNRAAIFISGSDDLEIYDAVTAGNYMGFIKAGQNVLNIKGEFWINDPNAASISVSEWCFS